MVSGRGRDNSMYGQEKFLPGEATLKGGIVCLGLHRKKSLCGRFFFPEALQGYDCFRCQVVYKGFYMKGLKPYVTERNG